jgi:hypothetical protein
MTENKFTLHGGPKVREKKYFCLAICNTNKRQFHFTPLTGRSGEGEKIVMISYITGFTGGG